MNCMPQIKALFFIIDSEGNHRDVGDIEHGDVIEVILVEETPPHELDRVHNPQVLPESWVCPSKGHYRDTIIKICKELDDALNHNYEVQHILGQQLRAEWDAEEDEWIMRAFFNKQ